jgi:hypothetical protein
VKKPQIQIHSNPTKILRAVAEIDLPTILFQSFTTSLSWIILSARDHTLTRQGAIKDGTSSFVSHIAILALATRSISANMSDHESQSQPSSAGKNEGNQSQDSVNPEGGDSGFVGTTEGKQQVKKPKEKMD